MTSSLKTVTSSLKTLTYASCLLFSQHEQLVKQNDTIAGNHNIPLTTEHNIHVPLAEMERHREKEDRRNTAPLLQNPVTRRQHTPKKTKKNPTTTTEKQLFHQRYPRNAFKLVNEKQNR